MANGAKVAVRWSPNGEQPGTVWMRVPGFERLFALTRDELVTWRVYNHIFLSGGDDLFAKDKLRA